MVPKYYKVTFKSSEKNRYGRLGAEVEMLVEPGKDGNEGIGFCYVGSAGGDIAKRLIVGTGSDKEQPKCPK